MKKNVTIKANKSVLAKRIQSKLQNELDYQTILDVSNVIISFLKDKLLAGQIVPIENFGILSIYQFPEYHACDVVTKNVRMMKPFRVVKFRPHATLLYLLKNRRQKFQSTSG